MVVEDLAREWYQAGVREGETLLLHSNIQRTLKRYLRLRAPISPSAILESFLQALGPSGTLLLPLFNFGFTRGVPFDLRSTPSEMGVLTEVGRAHPGAVRTGHPIYSFAVLGRHSDRFRGVDNFSGYGADSPFGLLRDLDGKIGVLDLPDQHGMTFYHHVEELMGVDYRFHKRFTAPYTSSDGETSSRTYGLFVRDLDRGVVTHVEPAGESMWAAGLYSGDRPGEASGLRTVSARSMYDFVAGIIASGKAEGTLYRIEGGANG